MKPNPYLLDCLVYSIQSIQVSSHQLKRLRRRPLQILLIIIRHVTALEQAAVGDGGIDFIVGLYHVHEHAPIKAAIDFVEVVDAR